MRTVVELRDVHYTYPQGDGFALSIQKLSFVGGACSAVCGKNGSGKTTLGKLIAGLLRPTAGSVFFMDEDISAWPLGKIGSKIGYLFQEPSRQIFAPTVLEEITFSLVLNGMEQNIANQIAFEMLEKFDMKSLFESATFTLSRGEKQRLAIVAMLVTKPSFLVLDEPTTGLDSRRKKTLGEMLRKLTSQDVGILLISHDRDFVREYATNTIVMAGGSVET